MASSRRSAPADGGALAGEARVTQAVRCALHAVCAGVQERPARFVVALSGGRDSMVLLDAAARLAGALPVSLSAVHVHHGLSPNADAWARFCADECTRRAIAFAVQRVAVPSERADGLEAAARLARYQALGAQDADAVALAHHADDQAETLLLQLLRGAGPHGLAAMPASRRTAHTLFIRPLLELPRRELARYAAARSLAWVDDESNDDRVRTRNFIRHAVAPQLAAAFAGYPATFVRAAAHQAEAAKLCDELALIDARGAFGEGSLERDRLSSIAPHRARNLLRWFLRESGLRAPSAARLAQMLAQLRNAPADARVELHHDGARIGVHRGRVVVHSCEAAPFAIAWRGEAELALPHGMLRFIPAVGEGLAARLAQSDVIVRTRRGGERIRLAERAMRQPVKHLLQRAGVAHWDRRDLPLVFCGESLAAVPGVGVDAAFAAAPGAPGYTLHWHPRGR